jgi:hypothetical protein
VLDAWLRLRPDAVRSVRDRTGAVVGCSIVAEWRDIPPSLERVDPVVAAWSRHAARDPLPFGQRTLTHRRWLAAGTGEGPSGVQAAALLDVKRDYFRLRPHLGRLCFRIAFKSRRARASVASVVDVAEVSVGQRRGRKAARISFEKSSGSSQAAK